MGTTLKFLSENTVRKCTFGKADPVDMGALVGTCLAAVKKEVCG